jgi:signal peptidase I
MTKRKTLGAKPPSLATGPADKQAGAAGSRHVPSAAAIRETVESIVIAFVLAFLFRTFEAEAFVIPTGSMAPTLMGRHKDLLCPKCGCLYQVGASEEVNQDGALLDSRYRVDAGTCPMCRFTADLSPDNPQRQSYPSYNGDRILVSKFAYEVADPKRWDVIVFKFPGDGTTDARTNFIKRLVGLPGDTIRIQHGDIWVRRGQEPLQIARKPPEKLLAMLQPVFQNDYMPRIAAEGWPQRWATEPSTDGAATGGWAADADASFRADGTAPGATWLRYRHLVPSYRDWVMAGRDPAATAKSLSPQYITDFTAYDTGRTPERGSVQNPRPEPDALGNFWVGDLALRSTVEIENNSGQLIFELRKGGRQFFCHIDVATGQAALSISGPGMESFRPTASTAVRGPGRYEILFSNCDNELRLWVDGHVVTFDAPTTYDDLGNTLPHPTDLMPAGVASQGVKVRLSHLAIFRDLYYIANPFASQQIAAPDGGFSIGPAGSDERLRNRAERYADYTLKPNQFFVLGDNSARSRDGRLWGPDNYWVPRELLIGKALFIYWPHSWNKVPYVNVPFPYFPNFSRMGLVR